MCHVTRISPGVLQQALRSSEMPLDLDGQGAVALTRLSMLRSMASSRKAASGYTLWMEPTTVALEAGMPKMNVQMESRSN